MEEQHTVNKREGNLGQVELGGRWGAEERREGKQEYTVNGALTIKGETRNGQKRTVLKKERIPKPTRI